MSAPGTVVVNGHTVPNGFYDHSGQWHEILCTCGPDALDEKCPYHGRSPFMVCDACNYDRHQCPGCGDEASHEKPVCDGCLADLKAEREVTRAATSGPYA